MATREENRRYGKPQKQSYSETSHLETTVTEADGTYTVRTYEHYTDGTKRTLGEVLETTSLVAALCEQNRRVLRDR